MKTLSHIFLFLVTLTVLPIAAQNSQEKSVSIGRPTDLNIEGLIGKVKRIDERAGDIIIVKGAKKESLADEVSKVFDESGRLTFQTWSGQNNQERRFIYGKNGVRKTVTEWHSAFDKPDQVRRPSVSASVFKYDEKENSILEMEYRARDFGDPVIEANIPDGGHKYFFDNQNHLIKEIIISSDGRESSTKEYFYRDKNHPTDMVLSVNGRAPLFTKYTYEIDSAGNWTKRMATTKSVDPARSIADAVTYRKISYYKN